MVRKVLMAAAITGAALLPVTASAAQILGSDAAACTSGGPAIRVTVDGLKDRTGELKLELFPANDADFLKDDRDLIKEGKFFRRVRLPTPASGPIVLCIRVPTPGPYALLFTHNRDGKNKFNLWQDGAGFPTNARLGRSRPKLAMARIVVPQGVVSTEIRAQYLRGLGGFGPLKDE
ncbi:MAG: DUF2141 domain-containing protein [Sphingomonas sp.]|jgi:uncharacterized protein (DUF2141 family)|nr:MULTISPECIES: DUF2141 domain-containing protein [unclassified Sphingomonas]MDR6847963.1 uncharacterized protein (DUF2141 family) [Sphingomonas sp. BE137]MDR7258357.1 uncharacterized protein (DUF2141 family) [Sphingomonas sp. BE270]